MAETHETPAITHGETITDRESVFQGHAATVVTEGQVRSVIAKIKEDRNNANAKYIIHAYRIYEEDEDSFIQDCDDGGEKKAGEILMSLLEEVNAKNVIVVVTRCYGGKHLGPDRYQHIENSAKQVLELSGHITSLQKPTST